jgi:hypothetical protein
VGLREIEVLQLGLVWVCGYLRVCRFEGDGGVRFGFVGLREMARRQ